MFDCQSESESHRAGKPQLKSRPELETVNNLCQLKIQLAINVAKVVIATSSVGCVVY